ncbi:MAG: AAA family ATPase [Hespellia sp.]|nr:AAA family ATPase [Hespellia sp.]
MDIKRAKQEIENTIRAYLQKDEFGDYQIPAVRQRPVLLMGPPGIGKTQIMEQIARDCRVGLVAYTITHHTRQSAVGLPFIQEKEYGGNKYSVTEYTMSEIIASVYEKIEKTGCQEGILFIDEINCVSETLAPTMLQFLQKKTFGNQEVPKGWIIVSAGNPPEYNKSVREFDVVTLDRIKKIDVEENLEVWIEYAYRQNIHPAIISYLEMRRESFYKIETTVDGKQFATARGWEDLSQLLQTYERLQIPVDREVVFQYIQHWKIAKDFANYLELYQKYKQDYGVGDLLDGKWTKEAVEKLRIASFDEKLCVVNLLSGRLGEYFREYCMIDGVVTKIYEYLKPYGQNIREVSMEQTAETARKDYETEERLEVLNSWDKRVWNQALSALDRYAAVVREKKFAGEEAFAQVKLLFGDETKERERILKRAAKSLEYAFDFMEEAFGDSQEMVSFITELNANYYSLRFLQENGCDRYYRYNKGLLFEEEQKQILQKMDDVETLLNQAMSDLHS